MNKLIKIIILILFLGSASFSALYYFNLPPFQEIKKQVEDKNTSKITPQATPTIADKSVPPIAADLESKSSCLILPEEYCSQGKPIYEEGQLIGLGFRVPEGTIIYTPFKSELETSVLHEVNGQHYPGLNLIDVSSEDYGACETRTFFAPLGYLQLETENKSLEKAQILAKVGSLTVNNQWGDYNLILTFRVFDLKKSELSIDTNLLKQFFNYVKE